MTWPKKPIYWMESRTLLISIPFTWHLQKVRNSLRQRGLFWDHAKVGGPAVELMPGYFDGIDYVSEGHDCPGVLERINRRATRTTVGCNRRCTFCAIGKGMIEKGGLRELADWPNRPVLMDANLLAATDRHIERVFSKLIDLGEADFNQGLDARLLRAEHAEMIQRIRNPMIRLALDHNALRDEWSTAFERLRIAGIAKEKIRSYCLIGYDDTPKQARDRCDWVEGHGVKALPMWFHSLDALQANLVSAEQRALGWTDEARRNIMQWYYQHKRAA